MMPSTIQVSFFGRQFGYALWILCGMGMAPSCTSQSPDLADVFKPLDGTWAGKFYVLHDAGGQQGNWEAPAALTMAHLKSLGLDTSAIVHVRQMYDSKSPFEQDVHIEDRYVSDGDTIVVSSIGVNKIEDGRLMCIVRKPDETVVHTGTWDGAATIIWQRRESSPLKVEYFQETVGPDAYTILGWGYYGEDDTSKSPQTWFLGRYKRKS